jgi:hypothetical protein
MMKFASSITSLILILISVSAAWGEDQVKLSESELLSTIYYLKSSAQLVRLESQLVLLKRKYKALGFKGGTTVFLAKGEKSPVRIPAETQPQFVIRTKDTTDPAADIHLYRLTELNGSRVTPLNQFNGIGRVTSVALPSAIMDFNSTSYGTSSVKLVPTQPLVAGEYCFVIRLPNEWPDKNPGFCFGIDAAGD